MDLISLSDISAFIRSQLKRYEGFISLHDLKKFAHTRLDEVNRDRSKTRVCQHHITSVNGCSYGLQCRYAHEPSEIVFSKCSSLKRCKYPNCVYLHSEDPFITRQDYFNRMVSRQRCIHDSGCRVVSCPFLHSASNTDGCADSVTISTSGSACVNSYCAAFR